MIFDVHVHTQEYSSDSMISVNSVLRTARELGLSGVCLTDHGTSGFRREAKKLSAETGLTVIGGLEYSCMEGHLLIFGVPEMRRVGMSLADTLIEVKLAKGIAIAAHPFRWDTPLMGAAIRLCHDKLDGIEAFNGGATTEENLAAHNFAKEHNLVMFGGSDAHHSGRVGRFATDIVASIRGEGDFIDAILRAKTGKKTAGEIFPVTRKGSHFSPALISEKQYREKYDPPPVKSLHEIFQKTKNR